MYQKLEFLLQQVFQLQTGNNVFLREKLEKMATNLMLN